MLASGFTAPPTGHDPGPNETNDRSPWTHPTGAPTEAAMRADEFLDQGIIDGERRWIRIMQAIEELQRERPRTGEAVH